MIQEGSLAPGQFDHPLQSWQLESATLNALLIAIVTTVLSYQVASIAYDLLLGIKSPHLTRASDFHAAILTDEGSLISIWAALLRRDWLDRARFPRKIPHGTSIAREPSPVRGRVIGKLFLLLIAAPLVNILAIILTLERSQEISFAQAEFGGLAVGVNEDFSRIGVQDFSEKCSLVPLKVDDHQRARASFFLCSDFAMKDSDGSWMSIGTLSDEMILVTLVISGIQYEHSSYFGLGSDQGTFRIRQRMTESMLRLLMERGYRLLSQFCLRSDASESDLVLRRDGETEMTVSRNVSCTQIGFFGASTVIQDTAIRATLIESDTFEVVRDSDQSENKTEYMRADDLILLEQRTSYAGLGTLFVAAGCAVCLRIIVKLLTRNDVHDGLEIMLRACFGVEAGDSLLKWNGVVRYDHKHQEGEIAHFGVKYDGLQEVKEFVGGSVGVVDERSPVLIEKCITVEDELASRGG